MRIGIQRLFLACIASTALVTVAFTQAMSLNGEQK